MTDEERYQEIAGVNLIRTEPSVRFFPMWNLDDIGALKGLIEFGVELSCLGTNLIGVEIGTGFGESASILTSFPYIHFLHTCDLTNRNPERINALTLSHKLHFHHSTSIGLSEEFDNESIDFVYIDGDHSYESIQQDLYYWYNKVKPGGIIGGHDYVDVWPGVIRAVDDLCHEYGLELKRYSDHSWSTRKLSL